MKPMKFITLALLGGFTSGMLLAAEPVSSTGKAPEAGTPAQAAPSKLSRGEVKSDLATANKTKMRPTSTEGEDVPMASAKSTRNRVEVRSEANRDHRTGKHIQTGE